MKIKLKAIIAAIMSHALQKVLRNQRFIPAKTPKTLILESFN